MNATISTLLCATTLLAFAPPSAAQTTRSTESSGPVEAVLDGQPAPPGAAPLVVRPATCFDSIEDQATGSCLHASSAPVFDQLFPYPGINNTFVGPAFVGGGEDNQATGAWDTVGGGKDNIASGVAAVIGGGGNNTASGRYATVAGGASNNASQDNATVGGGRTNTASGFSATIAGGGLHTASGWWSTIGGGSDNTASGLGASVGGGGGNTASGPSATVAGGAQNTAYGSWAAVGGGQYNDAFTGSTVGGGRGNTASAYFAAVPGGILNTAMGNYSFAAGRRAKANHEGAFVWGDSQDLDKASSVADEFNVYCSGGARFFTNSAATTGVLLAPGGGSWSSVSDRAAKENLEPVDARAVLEGVVALPLATWNYREQDDAVRHMGPMAQDFRAAFGLGVSDTLIDTVDPDGVAFAAIQGLHELLRENNVRLAEKDTEIAELRARLERIEARASAR